MLNAPRRSSARLPQSWFGGGVRSTCDRRSGPLCDDQRPASPFLGGTGGRCRSASTRAGLGMTSRLRDGNAPSRGKLTTPDLAFWETSPFRAPKVHGFQILGRGIGPIVRGRFRSSAPARYRVGIALFATARTGLAMPMHTIARLEPKCLSLTTIEE